MENAVWVYFLRFHVFDLKKIKRKERICLIETWLVIRNFVPLAQPTLATIDQPCLSTKRQWWPSSDHRDLERQYRDYFRVIFSDNNIGTVITREPSNELDWQRNSLYDPRVISKWPWAAITWPRKLSYRHQQQWHYLSALYMTHKWSRVTVTRSPLLKTTPSYLEYQWRLFSGFSMIFEWIIYSIHDFFAFKLPRSLVTQIFLFRGDLRMILSTILPQWHFD